MKMSIYDIPQMTDEESEQRIDTQLMRGWPHDTSACRHLLQEIEDVAAYDLLREKDNWNDPDTGGYITWNPGGTKHYVCDSTYYMAVSEYETDLTPVA